MSDKEPLPPVEPELARLFAEEAARGPAPAQARAAVKASFLAAVAASGGPATATPPSASAPQPGAPVAPLASTVATAPVATVGWLKLGLSLLIGMGLGAGVQATLNPVSPKPPQVITKEVRVEVPVLVREPAPVPVPTAAADAGSTPHESKIEHTPQGKGATKPEPSRVEPSSTAGARDTDLAAENSLIARAQAAMGRGALKPAQEALRAHAERFPKGQLVEEREALSIQIMVMAGDAEGAKEGARRFIRRYPDSPLRSAVERALDGAP